MKKALLAKSALLFGVLLATMPAAEARGGFRGGVIIRPAIRPYYGYGAFGYGYPGYYGGYYGYGGFGYPGYAHRNDGQLKLETKQKDAQVYINGAFAGLAKDMKSTWLRQGNCDLELRAPDGQQFATQVYVVAGKTIHIHPELPADSRS